MRNNYKNIRNEMIECKDENDEIEDDGGMMKNGEIG